MRDIPGDLKTPARSESENVGNFFISREYFIPSGSDIYRQLYDYLRFYRVYPQIVQTVSAQYFIPAEIPCRKYLHSVL